MMAIDPTALPGRVAYAPGTSGATSAAAGDEPSFSAAQADVGDLPLRWRGSTVASITAALQADRESFAAEMHRAVRTQDNMALIPLAARYVDLSAQSDLTAKVVGKSISGIDQLTKLA